MMLVRWKLEVEIYQFVFGTVLPLGGCQYETFFQFRCSTTIQRQTFVLGGQTYNGRSNLMIP